MREEEWIDKWLAADDFEFLFDFLGGMAKPSARKPRLFACNCCRTIWHLIPDERSREAIEVAEQFADGGATSELLGTVHTAVDRASRIAWEHARTVEINGTTHYATREDALAHDVPGLVETVTREDFDEVSAGDAVDLVNSVVAHSAIPPQLWGTAASDTAAEQAVNDQRPRLVSLFRCVFGNPFRPVAVDPACLEWNGGTVVKLAQAAYEGRDLPAGTLDTTRVAILADALEEAGCADAEILGHLRGPGPHVLGCWAVDLIVGKQ
jgi:hypothetical protein